MVLVRKVTVLGLPSERPGVEGEGEGVGEVEGEVKVQREVEGEGEGVVDQKRGRTEFGHELATSVCDGEEQEERKYFPEKEGE